LSFFAIDLKNSKRMPTVLAGVPLASTDVPADKATVPDGGTAIAMPNPVAPETGMGVPALDLVAPEGGAAVARAGGLLSTDRRCGGRTG